MPFYCHFCDIEFKTDLEKHLGYGRLVQTLTINNPNVSNIDRTFYDCVNNHNKKFEIYAIEVISENEFETKDFYLFNDATFSLETYMKHLSFSHICEMYIKTFSDKRCMTYKQYLKHPMQMVERRLHMIIAKNPHLINSLNRTLCHSLMRKYSDVPFNNF